MYVIFHVHPIDLTPLLNMRLLLTWILIISLVHFKGGHSFRPITLRPPIIRPLQFVPYNSSQLNFVPLQFVSLQFVPFTVRSTYISSHYNLSPYNPSHIRFVPYSLSLCILSQFFAVNIHCKIIK